MQVFLLTYIMFIADQPTLNIYLGDDVDSKIILSAFENDINYFHEGIVKLHVDSTIARRYEKPFWTIGEYMMREPFGYWDQQVCRICLYRRRSEIVEHAKWLCRRHTYFRYESQPSQQIFQPVHIDTEIKYITDYVIFKIDNITDRIFGYAKYRGAIQIGWCTLDAFPQIAPVLGYRIKTPYFSINMIHNTEEIETLIRQNIINDRYITWTGHVKSL